VAIRIVRMVGQGQTTLVNPSHMVKVWGLRVQEFTKWK